MDGFFLIVISPGGFSGMDLLTVQTLLSENDIDTVVTSSEGGAHKGDDDTGTMAIECSKAIEHKSDYIAAVVLGGSNVSTLEGDSDLKGLLSYMNGNGRPIFCMNEGESLLSAFGIQPVAAFKGGDREEFVKAMIEKINS